MTTELHSRVPESPSFGSMTALLGYCRTISVLQQLHSRFVLHGLHQNPTILSELIIRYADLQRLDLSQAVFDSISTPNAFLYNSIIGTIADPWRIFGLYKQILSDGSVRQDESVCSSVIKSCCNDLNCSDHGEMAHCHAVKSGLDSYINVSNAIDKFYQAIKLDYPATLASLLRRCVDRRCLFSGRCIHALAVVSDLGGDLLLCTAILTMYSKLGNLETARKVFDKIPKKDSVVWNTLISGYSRDSARPEEALALTVRMAEDGIKIDFFTAIASLSSAANLRSLAIGREIHGRVVRNVCCSSCSTHFVWIDNALIDMYSKCQSIESARKVFDNLANEKTLVSWSSMIKGYHNNKHHFDALLLFDKMIIAGIRPDSVTLINVLPACVHIGALQKVQTIHSYVIKQGFNSATSLVTALLVTYAKCGCIKTAQKIFDEEEIGKKDIVSWNAMINAYSKHGNWPRCSELYNQMKKGSVKLSPDKLTFLGLLTASANSGLVAEGRHCFRQMVEDYGYRPEKEHYATMVDLLGRAGHLSEAMELIESMPLKPDALIWGPLLSACKLHSNTQLAEFAAKRLIDMEPDNAGNFVLLSNVYAAAGNWENVAKMRKSLKSGGMKKNVGYSWLEINGRAHQFCVADATHPRALDIYNLLRIINHQMDDIH